MSDNESITKSEGSNKEEGVRESSGEFSKKCVPTDRYTKTKFNNLYAKG